jgi:hypothetical protein
MISIFLLWIFHLYLATFEQHLQLEYISVSWYDIPERVVPIRIALIEGCGRHHDLIVRYGMYVSQMTKDMFHLSQTLPGPFLIHDLSPGV